MSCPWSTGRRDSAPPVAAASVTARAPLTPAEAGRRYLVLTALRWLPVGISIPVTVLLALSRGLSLANVGLVFLAHSLLVAVLGLPTSGLADVVGRRPVLVAFGVLHLLSRLAPGPLALGLPRDLPGSPERRAPQPVANGVPP